MPNSSWTLYSPNGRIAIDICLNGDGRLSYSVCKDGIPVIEQSPLGIVTDMDDFRSGLEFTHSNTVEINETYSLPYGKKSVFLDHAKEMELRFRKQTGELHLFVRAYDDGFAYRYFIPGSGKLTVKGEDSGFKLPEDTVAWAQRWANNYEEPYIYTAIKDMRLPRYGFPALFKLKSDNWLLITEAAVYDSYCACHFYNSGEGNRLLKIAFAPDQTEEISASCPFNTPWRAAIIGDNLDTIINSTLVWNLNPDSELPDTSWIKPGRSSWCWWSGDSTSDYETAVKYVDFASELGWEHYLCDEGWKAEWVPQLVEYAAQKDVSIWLWSHYTNLDTDEKLDSSLSLWADWGVKGIKVDFFDSDCQERIAAYDRIAKAAAVHHLMINFHGSTKPAGEQRRWPHVMTREGVMGAEHYGYFSFGPSAAHNCTLPFTRNVIGHMDYTPVTFLNNEGKTTWAHQVALPVIFESCIQHFADRPESYRESGALDFLKAVPASWDETRLLDGFPGKYVVMARRKGDAWFIGAICSGSKKECEIPMTFLGSGRYTALIYKDGSRNNEILFESEEITNTDTLQLVLRQNGGSTIHIVPGICNEKAVKAINTIIPESVMAARETAINDSDIGPGINQYQFFGEWARENAAEAFRGDIRRSRRFYDHYLLKFFGTQVRVYGTRRSDCGIAAISIDGGYETLVDYYSLNEEHNALIYTSPVLPQGVHILKVRVTTRKVEAAESAYITADRIVINNDNVHPAIKKENTSHEENLALGKPSYADDWQQSSAPCYANDGDLATCWVVKGENHWLKIDLEEYCDLTGTEVTWDFYGKVFKYKIEVSADDVHWVLMVDKTDNNDTCQTQADNFTAKGIRYVRITVTGLQDDCLAAVSEFKVFG